MALVFADGFDAYNLSQVAAKWGTGSGSAIAGPGRLGYGQYFLLYNNNSFGIRHSFPLGPYTSLIIGFAFYVAQGTLGNGTILAFEDSGANHIAELGISATGQFQYGTSGHTYSSASGLISSQAWCYLECQVTFSNTTSGSVTLRVNGQTVVTQASVTTASSGAACSAIEIVTGGSYFSSGSTNYYDDLYVLNTTAPNNTFLGDVKILPLYPVGNGRVSGFSRFGGTTSGNYTAVNEVPPDGDASYVYTATPGTTDAYTITTLSNVTTIKAVQLSAYARKDDTPSRVLSLGVGNGTTESFDAGSSLNTSYTYVLRQLDTNPLTSAAWAVGDFTTLQLAQQLIS
jgi:hypothetical protein